MEGCVTLPVFTHLFSQLMPIYAYKCETCGHAKDVLQKMSDPLLTDCPVCGSASFKKQLTAAGFQLKGTGWYVTDFKEGGGKNAAPNNAPTTDAKSAPGEAATGAAATPSENKISDAASVASPAVTKTEAASKPTSVAPAAPSASKATPVSNA